MSFGVIGSRDLGVEVVGYLLSIAVDFGVELTEFDLTYFDTSNLGVRE